MWLCIAIILILCPFQVWAAAVTLAWDASPDPVTGYILFWGEQSVLTNPSSEIDTGNVLQYQVSGLTNGKTYYFALKAYNAYGKSGFSNEVNYAVPTTSSSTSTSSSSISSSSSSTTTVVTSTTTSYPASDPDKDGWGISDICPNNYNPRQLDADRDGVGDVCDTSPGCGGCGQPECEKSCP